MCFQLYEKGRSNITGRAKRRWDGEFQCAAETVMAVQDVHQHSIKHRPETLTAGKRSKRSIRQLHRETSNSSSSLATDPVEAYEHLQRDEWKFFLTEWEAEILPSSINESMQHG